MVKRSASLCAIICMAVLSCGYAAYGLGPGEPVSIVDTLGKKSGGRIVVNQSQSLKRLMVCDTSSISASEPGALYTDIKSGMPVVQKAGYRIQVYSDNKQRTAKAEVQRIASQISQVYPSMGTYISYKAPFWRLKVGDFLTQHDAAGMLPELKKAFPSLAGEMIIVRDRINVVE